ncbi:MAG: hypothetical protein IKV03_04100 [Alphaproteobacteria bacterium]|nr:hypothetical protein [Alphaproteobacteria bacterium]
MKKILILTCGILMVSFVANACEGVVVKGNSGASYCLSKHQMNWYSAYAWCKDQGKDLVELKNVCGVAVQGSSCPEFKLSDAEKSNIEAAGAKAQSAWTQTSSSPSAVYYIYLGNSNIHGWGDNNHSGRNNVNARALCQ